MTFYAPEHVSRHLSPHHFSKCSGLCRAMGLKVALNYTVCQDKGPPNYRKY